MGKKEITIDDLAMMVQRGFNETARKADIDGLKKDVQELKKDMKDIKADLNKKVDIFTHKGLEFRVEKLEEKMA